MNLVDVRKQMDSGQVQQAFDGLHERLSRDSRDVDACLLMVACGLRLGQLHHVHAAFQKLLALDDAPQRWLAQLGEFAAQLDAGGFRPLAQSWLHEVKALASRYGCALPDPLPLPAHLATERHDPVLGRTLKRYPPFEGASYIYAIDVAGTCNLRCPSCPVGNMRDVGKPTGLMSLDVFKAIVAKIATDQPATSPIIHLFNWGEPLLHPQLADMVLAVRQRGWRSYISTTLNVARGLDALVIARPALIKVSISGDTAQTNEVTHARSRTDRVLAHLRLLSELLSLHQSDVPEQARTRVVLAFHEYKHNGECGQRLRAMAAELGFEFNSSLAVLQPVEKNIDVVMNRATPVVQQVVELMEMSPRQISALNRMRRSGQFDCESRFNMTAINFDGSVSLCCNTYSPALEIHPNFLQASHQTLEAKKYQHGFCKTCMSNGFHYSVNDQLPPVAWGQDGA